MFFGLAYPQHLHYQEQYQLFLFDSNYVWDIVKQPGGVADLLGRFCTQFFLYAWVGAAIIALLLSAVQLMTLQLMGANKLYGLSFIPSGLLWPYLLDEMALFSGVWAILLTLFAAWVILKLTKGWIRYVLLLAAIPVLYYLAGPVCLPIPVDGLWAGIHYYRMPKVFPWLLWAAAFSAFVLVLIVRFFRNKNYIQHLSPLTSHLIFALVAVCMGWMVWKNANFKAEKVMQYDFMATHQQWNRIIETINKEKPNNQIGVTVQNLALAMRGVLLDQIQNYNQNGIAGLLPDVQSDATSPMPTAEAF